MCGQEYAASHDKEEAKMCLQQLNCRPVHHELVKQALRLALEEKAQRPAILELLRQLTIEGYVSETQLQKVSKTDWLESCNLNPGSFEEGSYYSLLLLGHLHRFVEYR